jgi:hypothetical protein
MIVVDDFYWLEYSKNTISNTITSINEAASKLEKMTLWFWGIYTASFTIGITINLISAPILVLILLASPIVTLILTYWLCNWVQLPVISDFNPQIPEEIKHSFNRAARIKNIRLKITLFTTFLSALLLSSALFSLAFVKKKENLQVNFAYDKTKNKVIIDGIFPTKADIHIEADSIDNKLKTKIIFFNTDLKILDKEYLNCNIPNIKSSSEINVKVTWNDGADGLHSLDKKVICK